MSGRLPIIRAILRKDVSVFWPLMATVFVLLVIRSDFFIRKLPDFAREWSSGIAGLACMLLVLGVIHQDASASVRHDWLTRPIPRWKMIAAKLVLIGVTIYVPAIVLEFAYELSIGHSMSEALLQATTIHGAFFGPLLALVAVTAVTATLLEAAGAMVAFFVVGMVLQLVARVVGDAEWSFRGGVSWIEITPIILLPLLLTGPVLWLQYQHRRTTTARLVVGVASVFVLAPFFLPWNAMIALERLTVRNDLPAEGGNLAFAMGCFESMRVDADSMTIIDEERTMPDRLPLSPSLWTIEERRSAGVGALAFMTSVVPTDQPVGWKTAIGHALASYVDQDGQVLHKLQTTRIPRAWVTGANASVMANHYWLVPDAAYVDAQRRAAQLQMDFSVSVLAPTTSVEMMIDGQRQYYSGLGFCSAESDRATAAIRVHCFKRGKQPAVYTARFPEIANSREAISDFPDYTPVGLEFLSGESHRMMLRYQSDLRPTRVALTAFEVRAHVDRRLIAPGLLGGAEAECPAPLPSP